MTEQEKRWLEDYSRAHEISLAGSIREAISLLKKSKLDSKKGDILTRSAGALKGKIKDGLAYQKEIRDEWR
jgi:hypothetical protein